MDAELEDFLNAVAEDLQTLSLDVPDLAEQAEKLRDGIFGWMDSRDTVREGL